MGSKWLQYLLDRLDQAIARSLLRVERLGPEVINQRLVNLMWQHLSARGDYARTAEAQPLSFTVIVAS
jgi:hypothetical protein